MMKTILLTGATDGIGLETAKLLLADGHRVLLHGRNPEKLAKVQQSLAAIGGVSEVYVADLSRLADTVALAEEVLKQHPSIDVLINNAGVYNTPSTVTADDLDTRFAVNTIAPYLLTQRLLPAFSANGRIVNLSSAAQAPVEASALAKPSDQSAGLIYAQSKLALTMWSRALADQLASNGPAVIAVNPGSLLASKMVKDAYGVQGGDLSIGANILYRAALDDEFASASGRYYDNDAKQFAPPHVDALNDSKNQQIVAAIEAIISDL
ncbi:SDR family NAD(P)-dependent oxidoreductase [Neiella marina]|uniref:SDR family NAD(P)-dependent oxidoreductase n=1 Tax=Neiella holothuriorum TaxID=2870530 RepID=A0ABS7EKJ0_9GAMM|nr:SDR family NAD(P)-dependent oxidoreductase [Neiella holothuriorum]MBW8192864.1 SDR family NAD(P)-dependent oxidoreductase [Neiella holothuriorum]